MGDERRKKIIEYIGGRRKVMQLIHYTTDNYKKKIIHTKRLTEPIRISDL